MATGSLRFVRRRARMHAAESVMSGWPPTDQPAAACSVVAVRAFDFCPLIIGFAVATDVAGLRVRWRRVILFNFCRARPSGSALNGGLGDGRKLCLGSR